MPDLQVVTMLDNRTFRVGERVEFSGLTRGYGTISRIRQPIGRGCIRFYLTDIKFLGVPHATDVPYTCADGSVFNRYESHGLSGGSLIKLLGRPCWDGCSPKNGHAGGCPNGQRQGAYFS